MKGVKDLTAGESGEKTYIFAFNTSWLGLNVTCVPQNACGAKNIACKNVGPEDKTDEVISLRRFDSFTTDITLI